MLEPPCILYAVRYEVGTISRKPSFDRLRMGSSETLRHAPKPSIVKASYACLERFLLGKGWFMEGKP